MPQTANSSAERLIDRHGRTVNYVRISVTDRCDFRCVYCMSEDMEFVPRAQLLTLEEIATIARAFTELGVDKIRITGGEPLIRRNVIKLFRDIGELSALRELVLSTNGSQLAHMAMDLKQAGVKRINISLDSLNADKFRRITRVGDLNKVMTGIETALQTGFERIKINAVILKNRNHDEVTGLVQYAIDKGIDISFIEEMPLGMIGDHDRTEVYYSSDEAIWKRVIRPSPPRNPLADLQNISEYLEPIHGSDLSHLTVTISVIPVTVCASPVKEDCCSVWGRSIRLICGMSYAAGPGIWRNSNKPSGIPC